jgi:hypothetical protein
MNRKLKVGGATLSGIERPLELGSLDGLATHLGCQFDDLLFTSTVQPVDRRINSVTNAQARLD